MGPGRFPGLAEILAFAYPAATLVWVRQHPQVQTRYIWQNAALMAMRSLTAAVTIFPPAYDGCRADAFVAVHGGCFDKIFSGHIAYMLLAALHLRGAATGWGTASGVLFLPVFVEGFLLVASREHYTVDVIVAVFMALLVFGYKK